MKRGKIREALAFDGAFSAAGFIEVRPWVFYAAIGKICRRNQQSDAATQQQQRRHDA